MVGTLSSGEIVGIIFFAIIVATLAYNIGYKRGSK